MSKRLLKQLARTATKKMMFNGSKICEAKRKGVACDGQVYTVNYDKPQPSIQTNLLPLFED